MTPQELRTLIDSDTEASTLANAGAADMCAARCRAIAPKELIERLVTELSFFKLYAQPADAEAVLQQIETVAQGNAVVERVRKWLQPGAPGVDVGDPRVRAMLVLPAVDGGIGLTQEQAAPLLTAAEVEPSITGADVSTAMEI